jgi:hypothetical protein
MLRLEVVEGCCAWQDAKAQQACSPFPFAGITRIRY